MDNHYLTFHLIIHKLQQNYLLLILLQHLQNILVILILI